MLGGRKLFSLYMNTVKQYVLSDELLNVFTACVSGAVLSKWMKLWKMGEDGRDSWRLWFIKWLYKSKWFLSSHIVCICTKKAEWSYLHKRLMALICHNVMCSLDIWYCLTNVEHMSFEIGAVTSHLHVMRLNLKIQNIAATYFRFVWFFFQL